MNRYAAALGLADTHYANPIGLDERGNYSSAADLVVLTRRLLRDPAFAKIAGSAQRVAAQPRPPRRICRSTTSLLAPWAMASRPATPSAPIRPGRLRPAQGCRADRGRGRHLDRRSAFDLTPGGCSNTASRSTASGSRSTPVRSLPRRTIRYSGGELPLRAARTVAVGLRRGQRLRVEVRGADRGGGPAPPRCQAGPSASSSSTACAAAWCRCAPHAAVSEGERRWIGSAASSSTMRSGSSWRCSRY